MPRLMTLVAKIAAAGLFFIGGAHAQQNFDKVEIKTEKLSPTTYVLFGAGGNIGVSVGDDALFIIDDQYAPVSAKIIAALIVAHDNVRKRMSTEQFITLFKSKVQPSPQVCDLLLMQSLQLAT